MTRRILLVANQTLGSVEVAEAVRERVDAGATELWIVAPVTQSRGQTSTALGALGGEVVPMRDRSPDAHAVDLAEQRLREATHRFRALGITVGGEVGDMDPFRAISNALAHHEVDAVVISTLPAAVSRWLRADLPNRVHRKFHVPVATISSRVGQRA